MRKQYIHWLFYLLLFLILLLAAVVLALVTGEMPVSLRELPGIIFHHSDSMERMIITQIRLPRIVLGLAVSRVLSLAGVILQGIFKNPLVEPYTLGISGGAAIGVTLAIVLGLHHLLGRLSFRSLALEGHC